MRDSIRVQINGILDKSFPVASVQSIGVDALGGNDQVEVRGFSLASVGGGSLGADGGTGNDLVTVTDVILGGSSQSASGSLDGGDGADTLRAEDVLFDEALGFFDLNGGDDADVIEAASGNLEVEAGDGDDVIRVFDGGFLEQADGGAGVDLIDETPKADSILQLSEYANVENGRIRSGTILGNNLPNVLEAIGPGDAGFAGDVQDTLIGGDGDDDFIGTYAAIFAGGGADYIQGYNPLGTIDGGSGVDTIDLALENAGPTFDLRDLTSVENAIAGADVTHLIGTDAANKLTVLGPATVEGGDGNDTLIGSTGNDSLLGQGGTDQLEGRAGNDTLRGGDGNDRLFGGSGSDQLFGGANDDLLDGQGDADTLDGEGGTDRGFDNAADLLISIEQKL